MNYEQERNDSEQTQSELVRVRKVRNILRALEIKYKRTNWVEEDISTDELIDFVESKRERAHELTNMLEDLSFDLSGILRESYDIYVAVNQIKYLLGK